MAIHIPEVVQFAKGQFTFTGINAETSLLESVEDSPQTLDVLLPCRAEDNNII